MNLKNNLKTIFQYSGVFIVCIIIAKFLHFDIDIFFEHIKNSIKELKHFLEK